MKNSKENSKPRPSAVHKESVVNPGLARRMAIRRAIRSTSTLPPPNKSETSGAIYSSRT